MCVHTRTATGDLQEHVYMAEVVVKNVDQEGRKKEETPNYVTKHINV